MEQIDQRFEQVDERFGQVDKRLHQIDGRLEVLGSRVEDTNEGLGRLEDRFDRFQQTLFAGLIVIAAALLAAVFT